VGPSLSFVFRWIGAPPRAVATALARALLVLGRREACFLVCTRRVCHSPLLLLASLESDFLLAGHESSCLAGYSTCSCLSTVLSGSEFLDGLHEVRRIKMISPSPNASFAASRGQACHLESTKASKCASNDEGASPPTADAESMVLARYQTLPQTSRTVGHPPRQRRLTAKRMKTDFAVLPPCNCTSQLRRRTSLGANAGPYRYA